MHWMQGMRRPLFIIASISIIASCASFSSNHYNFFSLRSNKEARDHTSLTALPSWEELESNNLPWIHTPRPTDIDSCHHPKEPKYSSDRPTLFRERHGWCPYSERVWLSLEYKEKAYDTVRIDNTGHGDRPRYFSGQTPQVRWGGGRPQGESMDLVHKIMGEESSSEVQEAVRAFRDIFPSNSRPSSRAAFLFSWSGDALPRSEFERVLSDTNEFLSSSDGPYFCGNEFSMADVAWVPFLERYAAQLPCLHDGLNPRDEKKYPYLVQWYNAMDRIPAYACRVKGDASSWRKVLKMAGFGNAGVPPDILNRMDGDRLAESMVGTTDEEKQLWREYASTRSYLADTAAKEAAATIIRNRDAIQRDAERRKNITPLWKKRLPDEEGMDRAMRALVSILMTGVEDDDFEEELASVQGVGALASFLDERMCVPRDMGAMSAAAVKRVSLKLDSI